LRLIEWRASRSARATFWAAACFAFVMAIIPHPPQVPGEPNDKVQHIVAFATLSVLGSFAYPRMTLVRLLIGLSLFLTFFVMSPVLDRIYSDAYKPFSENRITMEQALDRGAVPLRTFMLRQTREADLSLFVKLSNEAMPARAEDVPMKVLIPAYVTSELKTAFQIGFVVFIPFLIIDMLVASVLMSMGMMMVSPVLIALPFKIMLFVLVDGWNLLIGSLAQSFG